MTELHRVIELPADPAAVWEALRDVSAVAGCLPGCEGAETVEEGRRYRATVRDRVGPFRVTISLDVRVEATPPHRLSVIATGRDGALGSPVTVGLVAVLAAAEGGGSRLTIDGSAEVGGKLAALGQGVIPRRTKDVLDQFAATFEALMRRRSHAAPARDS